MRFRNAAVALLVLASLASLAGRPDAYPGGTPRAVTNAAPYCASCHSSVNAQQLRDMPADAAAGMVIETRHYSAITGGDERYQKLEPGDRQKLLDAIKAMDANSRIELAVSAAKVKPSGTITVTVTTRGGAGPVVGVMLTDNDMRFQAGPVQAEGFVITKAPDVTGPDGKPQTKFLDGRAAELTKNINYVNIQDVQSDPAAGTYPTCKVVWTLAAPAKPGEYTITAAFLYGTEKASPLGRVEGPGGRILPVGGQGSASGRIQFAKPVKVVVG